MWWNRSTIQPGGFTLIEVLVALSILSFAITGLVGGLGLGVHANAQAARMREATTLAEDELIEAVSPQAQDKEGTTGAYRWEVRLTELQRGLKLASVTVTWPDQGKPQVLKLDQIVFAPRQEGN